MNNTVCRQVYLPLSLCVFATLFLTATVKVHADDPKTEPIQFNRDIRPILSDNCFQCHGPDSVQRKGDLRLDVEKDVLADRGGYHVLKPGNLKKSELWARITSTEKAERMPPTKSGKKLTAKQITLLKRWIEEGANWQQHWALIPPKRPALPKVKSKNWPKNPIDRYVLAQLEKNGLQPSPPADRATLIRRVSLDLTGLPPTLEEIDAFLKDKSPNAYEKVVDRLLKSPRYGERMALPWLDGARYADTNGYQADGERHMWRWRDWVIEAFNNNMPFDRFTIEQLAGDLLPDATLSQKIATGFNRNHRGNAEGGIIPEEYLVEYAVDRLDTTATVWMGLTIGCGRCHDHKYDPISQKDFYRMLAYFNNIPERGKVVRFGNSPPFIKAPTKAQQRKLAELKEQIKIAEKNCRELEPLFTKKQRDWEKSTVAKKAVGWQLKTGLRSVFPLDAHNDKFKAKGKPSFGPGKIGKAVVLNGQAHIDLGDRGRVGFHDRFTFGAWIYPTNIKHGPILTRMLDTDRSEGYSLVLDNGALQLNLVRRWLDDSLRVDTKLKLQPNRWYHVMASYDGSRTAKGVRLFVDGKRQPLKINLNDLNQDFLIKDARFKIGAGGKDNFQGKIDDVRLYERLLTEEEVGIIATAESIAKIVHLPINKRSPDQKAKVRRYFLEQHAPENVHKAHERLDKLQKQRQAFYDTIPTVMVMQERETPKETFILKRGEYDNPGEKVSRNVPDCLPPLPKNAPNNRLALARWLVSSNHPLTARVAINRMWQMYFGNGIVETTEDFGSQGDWPSHPQLLDWLATEFTESGWDMKHMAKLIVTSATYRQSSKLTKKSHKTDPQNLLLSRGPRVRLSAHAIRDQALFVSGLLVEKIGGPSVKPYQPKGLWEELSGKKYVRDKGDALYRRSLYVFWKRTIPQPALMTFDAANRESCIVRQTRTNTPLQALNLLNDTTFIEAARVFGQRMMTEGGTTVRERIAFAFRVATSRPPRQRELDILERSFHAHRNRYKTNRQSALKLLRVGDAPVNQRLDPVELAAYTAVANVILNLDETITRQ